MTVASERLIELTRQIKNGDMSCFDELYEATKRVIFFNIFSYVNHHESAEDLLQDTYVQFLKSLPTVKESEPILGYLMTISKNLSLNYLRVNNRSRQFSEMEEETINSHDRYEIEENELVARIKALLKPEEFRIVYLKVIEEYSHKDIAKLLNKPLGTITWAYNNAIKKLQKGLGNIYGKD
ncbi:MAG: sigma-70 family RNA polymerase sigma factor [Bacilli bacterium]